MYFSILEWSRAVMAKLATELGRKPKRASFSQRSWKGIGTCLGNVVGASRPQLQLVISNVA
jgi:hypothetical protein